MTKRACNRVSDISARLLATLGIAFGFAVISADAGALPLLFDGVFLSTTCEFQTPLAVTGVTGPVSNSIVSSPCAGSDSFGPYSAAARISSSSVDYGVMKMSGDAQASGINGSGIVASSLESRDLVTFQSGALSGQSGAVYAAIQLQAIVIGGGNWCLGISSDAPFLLQDICGLPGPGDTWSGFTSFDFDCSGPCVFDFSFPMIFGTPTLLDIKLVASTAAGFLLCCSSIDVSQSVYWAGIQSVTFGGQPVAFSLTSASGHDWTQSSVPTNGSTPVPEPASFALLAMGLAGLGLSLRPRMRRWA